MAWYLAVKKIVHLLHRSNSKLKPLELGELLNAGKVLNKLSNKKLATGTPEQAAAEAKIKTLQEGRATKLAK